MFEWSESQQTIRDMVRRFVEQEVVPHVQELEHGDLPPYGILRKLYATFGMDGSEMARARFRKQIEAEKQGEPRQKKGGGGDRRPRRPAAATLIPIIELCRYCPGMVTALGVSVGLTSAGSSRRERSRRRSAGPSICSPSTRSAPGRSPSPARARTPSVACGPRAARGRRVRPERLEDLHHQRTARRHDRLHLQAGRAGRRPARAEDPELRPRPRHAGLQAVGAAQEDGAPLLPPASFFFLSDVRVGIGTDCWAGRPRCKRAAADGRVRGIPSRPSAPASRRWPSAASSAALELSLKYARERVQFERPIGEYQLIQDKLARMEVARMNLQNLVFRTIELSANGRSMSFAEASAMKLYAARAAVEVAMEAVQVYGGNGYMAEYVVEQLARDAKVLQIYAGTDEIQIRAIAKELLKG